MISKEKTDWYFLVVLVFVFVVGAINIWAYKRYSDKAETLKYNLEEVKVKIDTVYDFIFPLPERSNSSDDEASASLLPPKK